METRIDVITVKEEYTDYDYGKFTETKMNEKNDGFYEKSCEDAFINRDDESYDTLKPASLLTEKSSNKYKNMKQGHLILAELESMVQRNEKQRTYMAERRKNFTPEQKVINLEKCRIQKRILRHNETPEKRDLRLAKERAYKHQKRMNLSPEEKERELVKNRIYKRLQRVYESPEKRKMRLDKDRLRKSKKRSEQKIYSDISNKMYVQVD